ncbi:hypothetical protein [Saccharopolyspora sp. NPDC049357]|uniref:hypothetical protein n=1 Tax=Saccharopolyspora sp. NPDC049357 TaxID=3154507 RepID=UPI00341E0686
MAGENVLYDIGVIPITSSDALGKAGLVKTVRRTFALAGTMKTERGLEHERNDNDRVMRYRAKLTTNQAIAHALSHDVGRIAPNFVPTSCSGPAGPVRHHAVHGPESGFPA